MAVRDRSQRPTTPPDPVTWTRALVPFLALLVALPAVAQTTGKIAGVVRDAEGNPFPGANVRIEGTTRGASADADGAYFIIGVPSGTYTVAASLIGFRTARVTDVAVRVDRTTEIDFVLEEELGELGEVTVVADAALVEPDRTSASAKVTGEEILALPVDSFQETVALQAGVTTDQAGGIHIRGGRSSEVKYYVDGVAVSNPFSNGLAVPVENSAVEEVEVISGTFNAEYGQANSGIVNIVTRSGGAELSGSFIGSVGGYLSGNDEAFTDLDEANPLGERYAEASLGGPTGIPRLSFFTSAKVTDREGWLFGRRVFMPSDSSNFGGPPDTWAIQATGDSAAVPLNGSSGFTALGKLDLALSGAMRLSYSLTRATSTGRFYNHFYRLNPGFLPEQRSASTNHLVAFNHIVNSRTFYDVRLSAFTTDFEQSVYDDPFDPRYADIFGRGNQPSFVFNTGGVDPRQLDRSSTSYGVDIDLTRQFGTTHLVKVGVEGKVHDLTFQEFFVEVDPRRFGSLDPQIADPSTNRNNSYDESPIELAAYVQDKIEIDDLIVNVGVRLDYFDARSRVPTDLRDPQNVLNPRPEDEAFRDATAKVQLSPRLGLAFPITDRGIVHASYGQFFQIPEFGRLYENAEFEVALGSFNTFIGNADLEPQRSTVYEIGLQQQLGDFLAVDVTGYYRDIRNLLGTGLYETLTGGDTYGRYENADFGSVRGVTAALSFVVPERGLRGGINYTFQSARGNGSDPRQAFFDAQGNNEATRVLIPLDWDQRHNLSLSATATRAGWTVGVIGEFSTGYPFTPVDAQRVPLVELRNLARYDPEVRLDVRATRGVEVAGVSAQLLVIGENLLDSYRGDRFPIVFPSESAAHLANGLGRVNTLESFRYNPAVQPAPRSIRVGLQFGF